MDGNADGSVDFMNFLVFSMSLDCVDCGSKPLLVTQLSDVASIPS
jgi:hypothetical protein